jgi:hypothetical protein
MLVKILEAVVLHIVTTIRGKTVDGKRITDGIDCPAQQAGMMPRRPGGY